MTVDLASPPAPFTLHVAGLAHVFHVHTLRGRERLSRPHVFDLHLLTSRNLSANHGTLVGRAATLTQGLHQHPAMRAFRCGRRVTQ